MKKEIFILVISLFSTNAMAQIEMFDESVKKSKNRQCRFMTV